MTTSGWWWFVVASRRGGEKLLVAACEIFPLALLFAPDDPAHRSLLSQGLLQRARRRRRRC